MRKKQIQQNPQYIILNEHAQVWVGIRGEGLSFSDNLDEAKPLETDEQFNHLKRMTLFKLEKIFV